MRFISTTDAVPLAVYDFGPVDAELTVVFVHGHCMSARCWEFVLDSLQARTRRTLRIVAYDHRGHGESGTADTSTYTINQLGRDLAEVLRIAVPSGPIVLVGHSMGAMTTMTYTRQFYAELSERVVGVAFIATAASGIARTGLGRALQGPWATIFRQMCRWTPAAVRFGRTASRRLCQALVRNAAFGTRAVSPRLVTMATAMLNETEPATMAGFLDSLAHLDEATTLPMLDGIPVLVIGGVDDLLTPIEHSVAIAERIPSAELVRVEGAGHGVILERALESGTHLARLVERAVAYQGTRLPAVVVLEK